ncbi:hypothetical protein BKA69DRAFT_1091409 [Paraphysoderma sedebokerense]|nr:hypothetical protein BKA69DRAFT_1091409 [Paraphysoderma sedebokerense]
MYGPCFPSCSPDLRVNLSHTISGNLPKPARAHHCRVCKRCILKMVCESGSI